MLALGIGYEELYTCVELTPFSSLRGIYGKYASGCYTIVCRYYCLGVHVCLVRYQDYEKRKKKKIFIFHISTMTFKMILHCHFECLK